MLGWVMVWIVGAMVIGALASNRERSGIGWFLLSLVISPLLAGLGLLIAGSGGQQVRCPACRELVRADAVKCKHCGEALTGTAAVAERDEGGKHLAIAIGAMIALVLIGKACS